MQIDATALERIVDRLERHGSTVRHNGSKIMAQCPSHPDNNPSLSIRSTESQVLVYCFAGCTTSDVLSALGMVSSDLFDDPRGATYRYDDGRIVRRTPGKRFMQSGNTGGAPQLYRLSRIANNPESDIYLVEGEKDVQAIESVGGLATCNPMGSANFDKVDVGPLRGRRVIAVVDRDAAGVKWAGSVRARLVGYASAVDFVEAAAGKDAADHIAAGHDLTDFGQFVFAESGLDEFADAVLADDGWEGILDEHGDVSVEPDDGWTGFDDNPWNAPGGDELTQQERATPQETDEGLAKLESLLLDTDGLDTITDPDPLIHNDILFVDSLAWLVGKPGHGKSFVTIDMAASVATGADWQGNPVSQGPVLYLVAEGARGIRKRVRAWEAAYETRMVGVDFLPIPVQSTNRKQWDTLIALATKRKYALIILDTQARITVGIEENSNKEMGLFVHQAEALRGASSACVLIVHHIGRNGDTGRGATTLDGALSTIMKVTKDGDQVTLECTKQKDAEEWEKIELTLVPYGNSVILRNTTIPASLQRSASGPALDFAAMWWDLHGDEWVSVSRLEESTDIPKKTIYRHKAELQRFMISEAREVGRGRQYRISAPPSR